MPNTTGRRVAIVVITCCIIILAMMLCYPAGYDQTAFSIGGDLVKQGEVPYRDFLDTKPPIIFYIYAFASTIFGHHDWAIRAFDVIYQILAMWLLNKLLQKHGVSREISVTAVAIYVFTYVGSGFWMTAQAETFALIPILLSVDIGLEYATSGRRSLKRGLLVGFLGGILFLLKYTLLVIPAGIVIWLLMRKGPPLGEKIKFSASVATGCVVIIGLYVAYLAAVGGLDIWMASLTWLGGYSSIEPLFEPNVVIDRHLQLFQTVFVDVFTLSMVACCAIGLYLRYTLKANERFNGLMTLCIVELSIGILATIYERKLFPYHYLKFLWAFAPLAAIGLLQVLRKVRASWDSSAYPMKRIFIIGAIGAFVFYSPILSLRHPVKWTYFRLAGIDVAEIFDQKDDSFPLKEMQAVASELKPRLTASDTVFFWGNHVGIYPLLGKLPTTICLTNTPLSTAWTPQLWKDIFYKQLADQKPDYIIVEKGDLLPFINGSNLDSKTRLLGDSFLGPFLTSNYDSVYATPHFDVYKRS